MDKASYVAKRSNFYLSLNGPGGEKIHDVCENNRSQKVKI